MNSVLQFIHEIDIKNKEKGEKHIKDLLLVSIGASIVLGLISSPLTPIPFTDTVNPYLLWFVNSFMLTVVFTMSGVILFTLISTGQVAKPRLSNVKSVVDFVANAPNKDEILQILNTLNDIVKKNAIQSYATLAEVFNSLYKRIGRVEKRLDDHDVELQTLKEKIIKLEEKEQQHLENERLYLNHNLRLTEQLKQEQIKNTKLKNEKKKADKIVNDSALTKNNIINTKNIHKENKFEELDE